MNCIINEQIVCYVCQKLYQENKQYMELMCNCQLHKKVLSMCPTGEAICPECRSTGWVSLSKNGGGKRGTINNISGVKIKRYAPGEKKYCVWCEKYFVNIANHICRKRQEEIARQQRELLEQERKELQTELENFGTKYPQIRKMIDNMREDIDRLQREQYE